MRQAAPAWRRGNRPQMDGAKKARPLVKSQCDRIYMLLAARGPMIRDEISKATGIKVASLCARLVELENLHLIRKAGTKRHPDTGVHVILYAPNDSSTA